MFYDKLYISIIKAWRVHCEHKHYRDRKAMYKKAGIELKRLSSEQKKQVDNLWKNANYHTHELVYSVTGEFDPKIVPEKYIRQKMELKLIDQMGKNTWSDKNVFDMFLNSDYLPVTLVRNICGELYDNKYRSITASMAVEIMRNEGRVFYKPSIDNGSGKDVAILDDFSVEMFKRLGENWVAQRVIDVCDEFRKLNPTAVSIMRLITFYVNGQVHMTSASMRVGVAGSIKDYTSTKDGIGSIIIGIEDDGTLKNTGYYPNGKKTEKVESGFVFGGMKIPAFHEAVRLVKEEALKLPHARFINWDVTIDKENKPLIIEYNIKGPGVLYYQYTNGSIFGNQFDEIYRCLEGEGEQLR